MTPASEATTPRVSASWWSSTTKPTERARRGLATEKPPGTRELVYPRTRDRARPPPRRRGALTSTRSWLKRASLRPSWRRSTARYDCFAPPLLEKLPRARAGQVGPQPHQHRLQRQHPEHALASEPEAHRSCNTATSHARSFNAPGAELAPRGASAHRAGGRATGRKLGVPHSPAGQCAGRQRRARFGGMCGHHATPRTLVGNTFR
jgi:hypothetical protein